ncbi:hypothetical protein DFQ28_010514 [Apophysomyces sp. BC1034]|nr:hypothetical protein DFQ30_010130 [Apophysomyces sp. BC1015]KAG0171151.1 hypothetical protein DFQ29_008981 [Apophysomyces sp. BC1021]KAG0184781.1 hypothetical protein DFQ28_010514 [Apophysomyces sp. BC1034]
MNESVISGTKRRNEDENAPKGGVEVISSPSSSNKRLKADLPDEANCISVDAENQEQHDVHSETIQTPILTSLITNVLGAVNEENEATKDQPQVTNESTSIVASCTSQPAVETSSDHSKTVTTPSLSTAPYPETQNQPTNETPTTTTVAETTSSTKESVAATLAALPKSSLHEFPSLNTLIPPKSIYPPYETHGMRMSVSAILSESGRGNLYREKSGSPYSPVSTTFLPAQSKSPTAPRGQSMPPPALQHRAGDTITQPSEPLASSFHSRSASQPSNIVPGESVKETESSRVKEESSDDPSATSANTLTNEQLVRALTSVPNTNASEPAYGTVSWNNQNSNDTQAVANSIASMASVNLTLPMDGAKNNQLSASDSTCTDQQQSSSSPLPSQSSTTTSGSSPSVQTTNLSALKNLPNINAALRRLSGAAGLESSKFPNLTAAIADGSSATSHTNALAARGDSKRDDHASPSEILGNALAAVAASATAGRSNTASTTATAAAIGNLAAITANISNILHASSSFAAAAAHRGSFSQEDKSSRSTALQLAGGRKGSGVHSGGSTLSSILDQALLLSARGTEDGQKHDGKGNINNETMDGVMKAAAAASATSGKSADVNNNSKLLLLDGKSESGQNQKEKASQMEDTNKKPQLIIKNEQVWRAVEGMEEKSLGFYLYKSDGLLPNMSKYINGVLEVRVPARYLNYGNARVRKRAVWGTDIYTDDSDVVAMAIHSGKYKPLFSEPEVQPDSSFALAIAGKPLEAAQAAKMLAISGKKWQARDERAPDHDLKVTVRVLPKLRCYASTIRHNIKSRPWGDNHDGVSFYVENVEKIKKGEARLRGRSSLKADIMAYEPYRKRALGLRQQKEVKREGELLEKQGPAGPARSISRARIKKSQRVMRLFQMRSELMPNKQ